MTLRPTPTVVITDCDHDSVAPEAEVLDQAAITYRLAACRTAADVIAAGGDAEVLINQYAPITDEVLAALPRCRAVVRYGVGVDNVDVEAASRHGVWVVNVPDYGVEEVADHTLALILSLLRGVTRLDRAVRIGDWRYDVVKPLRRLSSLTVGIVGTGRIGAAVAKRASCLSLHVMAYDVAPIPQQLLAAGVTTATFDDLLRTADVVTLHVPLAETTHHLIGSEQLRVMKRDAVLVNTARGGLVDHEALCTALDRGDIRGAALDVLEQEPPPADLELVRRDDVVLTPHSAWYSEESFLALKTEVAREAVRVLSGSAPRSAVNRIEAGRG